MSRIGKLPIAIPAGVTVTLKDNVVTVKGPKGELSQYVNPLITVTIEGNEVVVCVSEGYKAELELVGVGYRVSNTGNVMELALGFTHPIFMVLPSEIKVETKTERNKNPLITLESCDKQLLGAVCAKIRSFRKPEPYKGKGVKFVGEVIRRKSGKSAGAK